MIEVTFRATKFFVFDTNFHLIAIESSVINQNNSKNVLLKGFSLLKLVFITPKGELAVSVNINLIEKVISE